MRAHALLLKHLDAVILSLEAAAANSPRLKAGRRELITTYLATESFRETGRLHDVSAEAVRYLVYRAERQARRLEGIDPCPPLPPPHPNTQL